MNNEQAREVFNTAARNAKDADAIARVELAREYFCNAQFRKALADHVWQLNKGA